jgi:hypothetical protein
LYAGNAVWLRGRSGGWKKGADAHVLRAVPDRSNLFEQLAVVEVKSYVPALPEVLRQLEGHVARARGGARIENGREPALEVELQVKQPQLFVLVHPSRWRLPREFWFEEVAGHRVLRSPPVCPPPDAGGVDRVGPDTWRLTLPWSQEAIAASAYALTFWYMGQLGAELYAAGVPREWAEMSAAEAGQNAAKLMLYYAILRCTTKREWQRALALYNSYGFGYSLGMNFFDSDGAREMLWAQDLDEIAAHGITEHGCRIREPRANGGLRITPGPSAGAPPHRSPRVTL